MARAALDKCLSLRDDPRLKAGELEGLRTTLAQAAVTFYQEFLRLRGDDPDFRAERARAFFELADATWQLGKLEDAVAQYQEAADAYRALIRQAPGVAAHHRGLAHALQGQSTILGKLNRFDPAVAAQQASAAAYAEADRLN